MAEFGAAATLDITVPDSELRAARSQIESELGDVTVAVDASAPSRRSAAPPMADGGFGDVETLLSAQVDLLDDIYDELQKAGFTEAQSGGGGGGAGGVLGSVGIGFGLRGLLGGGAGGGLASLLGGGGAAGLLGSGALAGGTMFAKQKGQQALAEQAPDLSEALGRSPTFQQFMGGGQATPTPEQLGQIAMESVVGELGAQLREVELPTLEQPQWLQGEVIPPIEEPPWMGPDMWPTVTEPDWVSQFIDSVTGGGAGGPPDHAFTPTPENPRNPRTAGAGGGRFTAGNTQPDNQPRGGDRPQPRVDVTAEVGEIVVDALGGGALEQQLVRDLAPKVRRRIERDLNLNL